MRSVGAKIKAVLISIAILTLLALWVLPDILDMYDSMTGADGLRNIIAAVALKSFFGLVASIPFIVIGIKAFIGFIRRKAFTLGTFLFLLLLTVVIPLLLLCGLNLTRFNKQQDIKNISGPFADLRLCAMCISDLRTDGYDEYIIDRCELGSGKYTTMIIPRGRRRRGRSSSASHNEYTADFYRDDISVGQMQIGEKDYYSLPSSLPIGFNTKITVYKKSGFIRSIEPSVDFGADESYERFYTIDLSGGEFVYEKNADVDIDNLMWCGFKDGGSYDFRNNLFNINAMSDKSDLDSEYPGRVADELCLYSLIDGQFRRVSNVLIIDDYEHQRRQH